MHCLTATALECIRNDRIIFSDCSLEARPGDIVQIDGPNGSGKTSLLRILAGLMAPSSGEVTWNGQAVETEGADFRCTAAYVGHRLGLTGELTARENLAVAASLASIAAKSTALDPSLLKALRHFDAEHFADRPVRELSAGQKQRVALSRLIVTGAKVWFLDEPFTALDIRGIQTITALVEDHCDHGGIAILASHQIIGIKRRSLRKISLSEPT